MHSAHGLDVDDVVENRSSGDHKNANEETEEDAVGPGGRGHLGGEEALVLRLDILTAWFFTFAFVQ